MILLVSLDEVLYLRKYCTTQRWLILSWEQIKEMVDVTVSISLGSSFHNLQMVRFLRQHSIDTSSIDHFKWEDRVTVRNDEFVLETFYVVKQSQT